MTMRMRKIRASYGGQDRFDKAQFSQSANDVVRVKTTLLLFNNTVVGHWIRLGEHYD